jgi:hypothetical protein
MVLLLKQMKTEIDEEEVKLNILNAFNRDCLMMHLKSS